MAYNIAPSKQALLVSGTNIKTINNSSLLGSGNLTISGLPSAVSGDADKVVSVNSSGTASWQYAGLGAGSLGTNNSILATGKMSSITTATDNFLAGIGVCPNLSSGSRNTVIGSLASQPYPNGTSGLTTGNDNTLIGYSAGTDYFDGFGVQASSGNVCIGNYATSYGSQSVAIGYRAKCHTSGFGTNNNVAIGYLAVAGNSNYTSPDNTVVGANAIAYGSSGATVVGAFAYCQAPATNSVVIGKSAAVLSSSNTVLIGGASGKNTLTGGNNTVVGSGSFNNASLTSATNNTILGQGTATALTTGSSNIFLGYLSGKYSTTQSNELFIDNQDRTDYAGQQTKSLIYGVFNATPASQTLTINAATTSTYGIAVSTAGYGLAIKSGSNAKIGTTGAFPGGGANKVTVSTTAVTANSIILVSPVSFTGGLTSAPYITAISAGSTFDITVSDNSFTGTVRWMIVEATP